MTNPAIARLLEQLPQGRDLEFAALLEAVERARFTGPLTVDFFNGRPRQINLGQPVKLTICSGDSTGGLDNERPSRGG